MPQWQLAFARAFKRRRPRTPVPFDGIHASIAPEHLLRYPAIDWVCVGEGEEALVELCDRLAAGGGPARVANLRGRGAAPPPRISQPQRLHTRTFSRRPA